MSFIAVGPITQNRYSFFGVNGLCSFALSEYILEHGDSPNVLTDYLERYASQIEKYRIDTVTSYRYQLLKYLFKKFRPSTVLVYALNPTCQTIGFAKLNQIVLGTLQVPVVVPLVSHTVLGYAKL